MSQEEARGEGLYNVVVIALFRWLYRRSRGE
jgi:hypothetical protein